MNLLKTLLIIFAFSTFVSCTKKDDAVVTTDLDGLTLATTLTNTTHKIELYTATGKFQTGYNAIYVQVKTTTGTIVNNPTISWTPTMHMMGMTHSCPASAIASNKGYLVFQMAGTDDEYWTLTVDYTIDNVAYTVTDTIAVSESSKRVVETFTGTDNNTYVLALVNPTTPAVAVNDISMVLYKMESMTSFVIVDGYTIKIDPRMTSMGNHTSPNNVDLTQGTDKMYYGKLSLTMTGYWKINLQLQDASETIVKGEAVTDTNEGSSIYFELEF